MTAKWRFAEGDKSELSRQDLVLYRLGPRPFFGKSVNLVSNKWSW